MLRRLVRKPPSTQEAVDRFLALAACVNLALVAFDISYIPFRDTYLRYLPGFTGWYGETFKGIEPHRDTTAYLQTVNNFVVQGGLNGPQADALLQDLRNRSVEMIDQNPFEDAGKSGRLERIKNLVRDRTGIRDSSKQAFETFWSRNYLQQRGEARELAFFDRQIRFPITTNYYRHIGENGNPVDRFWLIDIWFMGLFATDFLIRTYKLHRRYPGTRYPGTRWLDTMLWRWYDVFLFLPFLRWLRVIPTTVRLNESGLVNLEPTRTRVIHGMVTSVAVEITEVVVLNVIDQVQDLIEKGDLLRWLLQSEARRRYVDLNGVDEVEAIARQLLSTVVYQVLPQVRPDLEELLRYTVDRVLQQSPAYRSLTQIPGVGGMSRQMSDRLASELTQTTYSTLTHVLEDPQLIQKARSPIQHFIDATRSEVSRAESLRELQPLIIDLLDEVKINYVKRLSDQEIEELRQQSQRLYEMTQGDCTQLLRQRRF